MVNFLKENQLTHGKKVNDLQVDKEEFWSKNVEELEDKKSPSLVNAATADALVAGNRAGLKVSDTLADILSDWLDIIESVSGGDILRVRFEMIFSEAGKNENKHYVSNFSAWLVTSGSFSLTLPVGCQRSYRFSHFNSHGKYGCKLIYFDTHTYTLGKMARMLCCRDNNIQRSSKRQRHELYLLHWSWRCRIIENPSQKCWMYWLHHSLHDIATKYFVISLK